MDCWTGTKAELESVDRKQRKQMYGMLHPRANVSRLYLLRNEGDWKLMSVGDCVCIERKRFAWVCFSGVRRCAE